MAYCNNCGAYIPDGQTKCLACGFDEAEQQTQAAAAAAAQSEPQKAGRFDSDFLKRQLEQQRQRQKENSKKWADAERARRQSQQSQQARQDRPRQQAQAGRAQASPAASADWEGHTDGTAAAAPNKLLAALSYLGPLCFLPMFVCPNDDFAIFHARQGLGLFILGVGANILASLIGLRWLVTLGWAYMLYMGMTAASAGKRKPLPYIGNLFQK